MYHHYLLGVVPGLYLIKMRFKKHTQHKAYISPNQHNKINEIPGMCAAASWIHLRSQVIQYKWNGTLHPVLQIPSAAFTAGWVMEQLKHSRALCFVPRLFCYTWHIGWESGLNYGLLWVWSSKHFKHIGPSLGRGWGRLNLFRSSSILPGPRLRPHCVCWQAGHIAHIHSINVLLAPFLTRWMPGSDRCTGRRGWHSVWLFERLGLSFWQDLLSDDRWGLEHRKEKGKRERKLTVLHHRGL